MSKHATQLATLHLVSDPPTGAQRASLVGWEADRGILVRLAGDGRTLPAQSLVAFDAASLTEAIARQAEVLVLCEATTGTPMILGVIHEPPSLAPSEATPEEPLETRVDGERVVLEGKQEIVLRCGASSITLHADGRVLIRGKHLVSRASGLNRITGASLRLN